MDTAAVFVGFYALWSQNPISPPMGVTSFMWMFLMTSWKANFTNLVMLFVKKIFFLIERKVSFESTNLILITIILNYIFPSLLRFKDENLWNFTIYMDLNPLSLANNTFFNKQKIKLSLHPLLFLLVQSPFTYFLASLLV